jgi:hypothetical protein
MKATELLQKQHRDIEALLERLHTAGQGEEDRIRHELAATFVAHSKIEEEHFYPAVRSMLPLETLEALEEHGLAEVQLARLLTTDAAEEAFEAKAAVLAEIVVRHIRREESEILKLADRELPDEHLHTLGERMAMRFRQVVESGFQKPLQKALLAELPRTPSRARRAAKKTARRAQAAKTARRAQAAKTTRRAQATKTTRRAQATKGAKTTRREATPARAKRRTSAQAAGKSRPTAKHGNASPRQGTAGTRKAAEKPARAARARRAPGRAARSRA